MEWKPETNYLSPWEPTIVESSSYWEVVCVRPSVCTCTSICAKDVYPSASNVGLRTRKENCLEWRPGFELDGFYFTPTNL